MTQSHISDALRVYCAGPLFNGSERREMETIAGRLCDAGYSVYVPHRDGMEFRLVRAVLIDRGWDPVLAGRSLHQAIFALDVYQLAVECDAVVWNLNGRTPDEGAVSEAAIAWTLGKPLVAYSDDARSLIVGRINPLLAGLVGFETVDKIDALPERLARAIAGQPLQTTSEAEWPAALQTAIADGRELWTAMLGEGVQQNDERIADVVTELFAPQQSVPDVAAGKVTSQSRTV